MTSKNHRNFRQEVKLARRAKGPSIQENKPFVEINIDKKLVTIWATEEEAQKIVSTIEGLGIKLRPILEAGSA